VYRNAVASASEVGALRSSGGGNGGPEAVVVVLVVVVVLDGFVLVLVVLVVVVVVFDGPVLVLVVEVVVVVVVPGPPLPPTCARDTEIGVGSTRQLLAVFDSSTKAGSLTHASM
jgi:hypothetical protein